MPHMVSKPVYWLLGTLGSLLATPVYSLTIFACEPEWALLAKELAPQAKVIQATHAYQDPHYIEARPSLISAFLRADLAICTGAEMEIGWLPALQQRAGNARLRDGQPAMIYAADAVETIDKQETHFLQTGHIHAQGNPHFQLDPTRFVPVAALISQRLIALDPDNAANHLRQHRAWHSQWLDHIARWENSSQVLKGKRVVVQHSIFDYLIRFAAMEKVADLEPEPGVPPTISHLQKVQQQVSVAPPDGILRAWYQDEKSSQWLAKRIDRPVLDLPASPDPNQAQMSSLAGWFDLIFNRLHALN